jgi:hypothetical protein
MGRAFGGAPNPDNLTIADLSYWFIGIIRQNLSA